MTRMCLCLLGAAIWFVGAGSSSALGQQSYDGKIDIAKLLATASQNFDTATEDAVVLSEGETVTRFPDGRFSMLVHRIVWINSDIAIDEYGDVRVPYDQDHCTFTPLTVRTWRDGRWWTSDSTGIVETLPFAMDHAYDYAGIQEMMLLFNGIEVPCIVEMAYRIEDRKPYRRNADGVWCFAREYPAVESWFEFCAPPGTQIHISVSDKTQVPESRTDQNSGLEIKRWRMGPLPGLPRPHSADPADDAPHLAWSTWKNWQDLGAFIGEVFRSDHGHDGDLDSAIDSLARRARTVGEKVKSIASFINDRVALIDYSQNYWWTNPRDAERTYITAYGHPLDRAILAAALFRKAGLKVQPLFISKGFSPIEMDAPSLSRFGEVTLQVQGADFDAIYDPTDGSIARGDAKVLGHTTWSTGTEDAPHAVEASDGTLNVRISLKYDNEKAKFVGNGLLAATGGLCPFDQMAGLDSEEKEYVGSVVASVIKGTTVNDYSSERFNQAAVAVGFAVELAKIEPDDRGRTFLAVSKPKGGIADHLPARVQLFRKEQPSSIRLPFLMSQRVEFRVDLTSSQVVYHPEDTSIANAAGRFSIISKIKDSQLVVARELSLSKTVYQSTDWPALRQLLLADGQEKHGLVLLKGRTDSKK